MHSTLALDFSDYVRITNLSDKPIQGRYDGRDYHWDPHDYQDVHKVVAVHIFGFITPEMAHPETGLPPDRIEDIKQRAMMRLGWLRVGEDFAAAKEHLKKIRIEAVPLPDNLRVLRSEDPHRMPQIEGLVPGIAGGSESRTAPPEAQASGDVSTVPDLDQATAPEPDISSLVGGGPRRKPR